METGTVREYEFTSRDNGTTITLWGPMEYGYRNRVVWAEYGYRSWHSETQCWPVWRILRSDPCDPRDSHAHVVECIDADDETDIKAHLLAYLGM